MGRRLKGKEAQAASLGDGAERSLLKGEVHMADKRKEEDTSSQGFAPNSPPDLTKGEPGKPEHSNPEAVVDRANDSKPHPPVDTGL
jgi:hypothetical protein